MIGIYKITNQINGKVYIGQSVCVEHRWVQHRSAAFNINDKNYNSHLYCSMRKYGIKNFIFTILEECSQEELNDKEIYWIKYYNTTDKNKGYNIKVGGEGAGTIYNYEEIYKMWEAGLKCKEIQEKLSCNDQTVSKALRAYGVSISEACSKHQNKRSIVALDIKNRQPLKIFNSILEATKFLKIKEKQADYIRQRLGSKYSYCGYYWEELNENNIPLTKLTDEEFFAHQGAIQHLREETRLSLSIQNRKVERPSREELKNLIRVKPFTQIGKMYGVTDNTIRKWCDFEDLPRKKHEINAYTDEEWALI